MWNCIRRGVRLFSVDSKIFEKLVNNSLVDHLAKCGLFFISRMISGLLKQLQIFWKLYLEEVLSRATRGVALDMSKVCQSLAYCYFSRGQVLWNLRSYLALCHYLSVIGKSERFWIVSICKNMQLKMVFLKASWLVLQFFCDTLILIVWFWFWSLSKSIMNHQK